MKFFDALALMTVFFLIVGFVLLVGASTLYLSSRHHSGANALFAMGLSFEAWVAILCTVLFIERSKK